MDDLFFRPKIAFAKTFRFFPLKNVSVVAKKNLRKETPLTKSRRGDLVVPDPNLRQRKKQ